MGTYPDTIGIVVTPGDARYDTARHLWNARFDYRPRAVVYPRNAEETAAALTYVRDQGIPFRIRSGGHNSEGFSGLDDGAVIDVSRLGALAVSGDRTRADLGPGVLLGEAYDALWSLGGTIPAGVCPDIRIGGHVLGGGIGMLVRSRGLLIDHLLGLTLVDAHGQILDVDAERHPDLLWASRGGGGGNFGIVTSYSFAMRPISEVTLFLLEWGARDGIAALDAWQHWIRDADPRVNARFNLFPASADRALTTGLFEGASEELTQLLRPLTDACPPRTTSARTLPYGDSIGTWTEQVSSIRAKFTPALAAEPLGAEALHILERRHDKAPPGVKTGIYGLGGAVLSDVPPEHSAFAHRGASLCVEYLGHWSDPQADAEHLGWLSGTREDMLPFMTGGAYVNSPDRDLTNWPHAYYGEHLPRLMEVKRRYDPDGVFAFEQSIPASLSPAAARAAGLPATTVADLRARGLLTAR
ncbi:FAD-binding oxidoreductase [Streptomyces sp. NPDC057654]|uniref:FAD-binding oxidoreductase n=1 Tax=Streptomyces sp. NPDC057654 TaxID=3346196 RepID=UPI0036BFB6C3